MFEHRRAPLLPRPLFIARQLHCAALGVGLLAGAMCLGTLGYHLIAHLAWIDAQLNAAMILTGMGPVDQLPSPAAKVFASCYALFSGVVFLAAMAAISAPLLHRVLHRFHLADEDLAPPERRVPTSGGKPTHASHLAPTARTGSPDEPGRP
jgi:hypothetical protein